MGGYCSVRQSRLHFRGRLDQLNFRAQCSSTIARQTQPYAGATAEAAEHYFTDALTRAMRKPGIVRQTVPAFVSQSNAFAQLRILNSAQPLELDPYLLCAFPDE